MTELEFRSAGLEVWVGSAEPHGFATLSPAYACYPSLSAQSDVRVSFTVDRNFRGSKSNVPYPGFSCRESHRAGVVELWRRDASGTIEIPTTPTAPVRGKFTLASPTVVEAPIRLAMSVALPRAGGLLLHASAIVADGEALLFSGKSGAGKSTIAELLSRSGWRKLADELVLLRRDPRPDGSWMAYTSPFQGPDGVRHAEACPVKSLHFLIQDTGHRRKRVKPNQALRNLLQNVLVYACEPLTAENVMAVGSALVSAVPCYELRFRNDAAVSEVLELS